MQVLLVLSAVLALRLRGSTCERARLRVARHVLAAMRTRLATVRGLDQVARTLLVSAAAWVAARRPEPLLLAIDNLERENPRSFRMGVKANVDSFNQCMQFAIIHIPIKLKNIRIIFAELF